MWLLGCFSWVVGHWFVFSRGFSVVSKALLCGCCGVMGGL